MIAPNLTQLPRVALALVALAEIDRSPHPLLDAVHIPYPKRDI